MRTLRAVTVRRPPTPPGFDPSRATERAADPRGWRFSDAERAAVERVIAERRDIRRFRPDEVGDDVLDRVLQAAHRAPSVGLMQPWRFIVVREEGTRVAIRSLARRERLRQADRFGLDLTRDNHAAATAFVALQRQNLAVPRPGLLYKIFRASHPPIGERVDFINTYRPR